MTLFEKITAIYPELLDMPNAFSSGVVTLQDNSDDKGAFIAAWNYERPEPTIEQLDALS